MLRIFYCFKLAAGLTLRAFSSLTPQLVYLSPLHWLLFFFYILYFLYFYMLLMMLWFMSIEHFVLLLAAVFCFVYTGVSVVPLSKTNQFFWARIPWNSWSRSRSTAYHLKSAGHFNILQLKKVPQVSCERALWIAQGII